MMRRRQPQRQLGEPVLAGGPPAPMAAGQKSAAGVGYDHDTPLTEGVGAGDYYTICAPADAASVPHLHQPYTVSVMANGPQMQAVMLDRHGTRLAIQQSRAIGIAWELHLQAVVRAVVRLAGVSLEQIQYVTYCQPERALSKHTAAIITLFPAQIPVYTISSFTGGQDHDANDHMAPPTMPVTLDVSRVAQAEVTRRCHVMTTAP